MPPDQITGPSDLGEKLEQVVHMALNEVVSILGFSLTPDDRAFTAILKAKTTILNSVLNDTRRETIINQKFYYILFGYWMRIIKTSRRNPYNPHKWTQRPIP
jgi:hypothetical protein